MATVDTLLVKIEADMSGLRRDLAKVDKRVSKTTKSMSKSFSTIGKSAGVLMAIAVVAAASKVAKSLVDLTGDVAEMQSKSSVVFGAFTSDIRSFAEEFGASVGR